MSHMTTPKGLLAHWPSIDPHYKAKFAKFKRMQQTTAKPRCIDCRGECWWSFTQKKWRHVVGNMNPDQFPHATGETVDDF